MLSSFSNVLQAAVPAFDAVYGVGTRACKCVFISVGEVTGGTFGVVGQLYMSACFATGEVAWACPTVSGFAFVFNFSAY